MGEKAKHSALYLLVLALAKANKHPEPEKYAETVEAFHDGKADPHAPAAEEQPA